MVFCEGPFGAFDLIWEPLHVPDCINASAIKRDDMVNRPPSARACMQIGCWACPLLFECIYYFGTAQRCAICCAND
jgi:hypothetical protein